MSSTKIRITKWPSLATFCIVYIFSPPFLFGPMFQSLDGTGLYRVR